MYFSKLKFFILISFFSFLAFGQTPNTERIKITIDQAKSKKTVVGMIPIIFFGNPLAQTQFRNIGAEIYEVVVNDLVSSTYFKFIDPKDFQEKPIVPNLRSNTEDPKGFKFSDWSALGADILIRAGFTWVKDEVSVDFTVYHIPSARQILAKKYQTSANGARTLAHTFANDLMEELTGQKAFFLSRLTFGSDRKGSKFKEIYVMDWDGHNIQSITNHNSISLSPAWSPDGKKIAYTSFSMRSKSKARNADIYVYELNTKKRWLVSYRPGLNSGPNFSPDGNALFVTISNQGNPDLYKIDLNGKVLDALTDGPRQALNVEPAVSPDGSTLAFSSDRLGDTMLFFMDLSNKKVTRKTFDGKLNSSPAWSPDGKTIAFTGMDRGNFDIYTFQVSDPRGTLKRITTAIKPNGKPANNEDPHFSPDGRFIVFTSDRTGSYQIWLTDIDGREEKRLTNDSANYYKPRFSPQ